MLLAIFLQVLLIMTLHFNAIQALDEGQVRYIANEDCSQYLSSQNSNTSIGRAFSSNISMFNEAHEEIDIQRNEMFCPPWNYWNNESRQCHYGNFFNSFIHFQHRTHQTWLQAFYCMTTSHENTTNRTDVIGSCLFSINFFSLSTFYPLPCNISQLNEYMCAGLNREGQLCGRCVKGFGPPVFSYSLSCVNCTDYHLNWLKYIGVAFGPLTLFCIVICIFHISATSPFLHGFVFFCQIITMPTLMKLIANNGGYKEASNGKRIAGQVYVSLLSLWNLDILRAIYHPFCLHPNMTIVQALALNYLIALYPLVLLLTIYSLVSLHSKNNTVIVKIWKPFWAVLRPLIRNLNIQTSLIESFATLYFLSAMKIQSVSLDLLSPTALYYANGSVSEKLYLFLAGDVEYFGQDHCLYGILAVTFLLLFAFIPGLLFLLYPCRFFQRFLNRIHCNSLALHTFMDVFQGNYKDGTNGTRDYRFFAGVFFMTRFVLVAIFILLSSLYSILIFGTILTMLGVSVAILHPQRTKLHYTLDCIILLLLSILLFSAIGTFLGPNNSIAWKVFNIFGDVSIDLPLIYIACLLLYWITVKKKVPKQFGRCVLRIAAKVFCVETVEQQRLLV